MLRLSTSGHAWVLAAALAMSPVAAAPPAEHGTHHAHGDSARVRHRFDDVETWVRRWDDPERDAWQEPERVVALMRIEPGMTVADIGAGTGYFNPHLARAVGPEGRVLAVDVESTLVVHMRARARREATPQVEPILAAYDDPRLPVEHVDRVLLVDTFHHIDARIDYFARLRPKLEPDGLLVNVDWKPGPLPMGPPPEHKLSPEDVAAELRRAGYELVSEAKLRYQYVQVFRPARREPPPR